LHGDAAVLSRPDADDKKDPARMSQTNLEQINVNRPFREVSDFFESVRYLHLVPQLVREPDRSVGKKSDPYGGTFLEQLASAPKRTSQPRLERIRKALAIAVPQLEELELYRDPQNGTPHLRGKYNHWRPQGQWQSENQFSDGTLRLIGLLWAVLDGSGPLLLEEPELSLHEEIVKQIPSLFYRIQRQRDRQILVSTHSEAMIAAEGVGIDEVLVIRPEATGSTIHVASEIPGVKEALDVYDNLATAIRPASAPAGADELTLFPLAS
jgi:predicted ATPase